jgi:hypothetical protein
MKSFSYFILFLFAITNATYYYDKYLNRDIYSLLLRDAEIPFYSSKNLYSNHYMKMHLNLSNFTQK